MLLPKCFCSSPCSAHGHALNGKKSNAEKLTKLHTAMNSKLYLIVWYVIRTVAVVFKLFLCTNVASTTKSLVKIYAILATFMNIMLMSVFSVHVYQLQAVHGQSEFRDTGIRS